MSANVSLIVTQLIVIPQTIIKCASQWQKTWNIPYHLTVEVPRVILCIKSKTIPTCISSKSSIRHPICQPLEYQSHTNIINALEDYMYNIHQRLVGATYKDGSIWPSTLGRWHSVQYMCMWSFHVWPFWPSNNNILEDNRFHTQKVIYLIITSNVIIVYHKYT